MEDTIIWNNGNIKESPEFRSVIKELSSLQINMMRFSVENDLDTYLSHLENAKNIDIATITHYADMIKFSANCPFNLPMEREMYLNPYFSELEMRASLLMKQDMLLNKNTKDVAASIMSQSTVIQNTGNDLNDMANDDDDMSVRTGMDMNEEVKAYVLHNVKTISVVTHSLFHVKKSEPKSNKVVSWDISDSSDSYSDYHCFIQEIKHTIK